MATFVQSFTYEDIFVNSDGIISTAFADGFALRIINLYSEIRRTNKYGFYVVPNPIGRRPSQGEYEALTVGLATRDEQGRTKP